MYKEMLNKFLNTKEKKTSKNNTRYLKKINAKKMKCKFMVMGLRIRNEMPLKEEQIDNNPVITKYQKFIPEKQKVKSDL